MRYTTNKNMKLPEYEDVIDIEDINTNTEIIDEHIGGSINTSDGVHGLRRVSDGSLQVWVNEAWVSLPYMSEKAVTDLIGDVDSIINDINTIVG